VTDRPYPTLKPRPVGPLPMIMDIGRSHLLWIVNHRLRTEGKPELPPDTEITLRVPGGGDYSNEDVSLDDKSQILTFRWKQ
jgi:hypothetical protein